jgi:plastocyanin
MKLVYWLLGALAGVVVLTGLVLCYTYVVLGQHIVLRLSSGFFPDTVYLEPGQSLRFVNLTLEPSWPASGPHPTHTTYSEFDPQQGIDPLQSWVFTFTREGTYAFHDHVAPEMVGMVIAGSIDLSKVADEHACTELADPFAEAACMEIYYRNVVVDKDFNEARDLFIDLATRYQGICHTLAHDLGKNAYTAYTEGKLPEIGQEASSCGFGFWHGFTTAMQTHYGIDASKEFCASLTGNTPEQQKINRMNCFHGVGIGLIPDPPQPKQWGAFQALVDPALAFCETVEGDYLYKERCLTGIFHAMTIYLELQQYEFTYDEHSLKICQEQALAYQRTCFITLVAALPAATGFDLPRTLAILKEDVPGELFLEVFEYAAILFVQAENPIETTGRFVASCEAEQREYRSVCIDAVINKLYNNGVPGSEYQKASAFCSSEWVYEDERVGCFDAVISYANAVYAPEKVLEACIALPGESRTSVTGCESTP